MPTSSLSNKVAIFQQNAYPPRKTLFEELEKGQHPEILFITCSDSRVNPNLLTQSEPGELFVIRNAGNIIPPYSTPSGEAGTIEYAIEVLDIKEIIVCGHALCGAMQGLIKPETLTSLPAVSAWIKHAAQAKKNMELNTHSHAPSFNFRLSAVIEANVLEQIEHLKTHPVVAKQLDKITIHGWVYEIGSGSVLAYEYGYFFPLGQQPTTLVQIAHEEAMVFLNRKSKPETASDYNETIHLLNQVAKKGIIGIWNQIKSKVAERMAERGNLFFNPNQSEISQLSELRQPYRLNDLSLFQQNLQESPGYQDFCSQSLRQSGFFAQVRRIPSANRPDILSQIIQPKLL